MLELSLLGTPTARLDGNPLSDELLNKDLALLYFLALTNRPASRLSLATLLWGDQSETAARSNLRKSLSGLRHYLGVHLAIERHQVELVRTRCTVDLWEFERLAMRGLSSTDRALLQAAIDLYRGHFLAGFIVHKAPDYDRWVYDQQEKLRNLAVQVLTMLAAQHAAAGEQTLAIAAQRRVLEFEPWREERIRELMFLLAASGQRSAALAQYKRCVAGLAAELGVLPDRETVALAERIRNAERVTTDPATLLSYTTRSRIDTTAPSQDGGISSHSTPAVHMRSNLPPEFIPIVGRTRELKELAELVLSPECRLVTILGEGGIGKTRLALALAHLLRTDFDQVAVVSLAVAATPREMLSTIGHALGLPVLGHDDAVLEAFRTADPHMLLVLDQFDRLVPIGVETLEQLLSQAPRVCCVVTSREALSTRWEWRYSLGELSFPTETDSADAAEYGSVQFFLAIARRRRRRAIEGAELEQVMRICRLVGGMPLGVELAAAQVGSLSCAAIADQIAAGVERLGADLRDLPLRQRSLLASFDASWITLSEQEQKVLARLSIIHGEFGLEAALHIGEATLADISRLVDKSLVRGVAGDGYSLHDVIQQHAARKLALAPGATAAAFASYRNYHTSWASRNLYRYTDPVLCRYESREHLEHHLRHLWHIWLNSTNPPDRGEIAVSLAETEQAYRTFASISTGSLNTWDGLKAFLAAYTKAAPVYSGVLVIDIVWLPSISDQLADLTAELRTEADSMLQAAVDACRTGNRLLAMPKDFDTALLYSRRDLLQKYGFAAPPVSWEELEQMATVIQAGERAAGHDDFWGFVWTGNPPEGFLCTALEWQHSEGGGCLIEPDGRISIANARAAAALARAARWVGSISPPDFGALSEVQTARLYSNGNAAFMRMWSSYGAGHLFTAIRPQTVITVLPHGSVRHAATLGGWPLAVHKSTQQRNEAFELIRTMGSSEVQRMRALRPNFKLPAMDALYHDPEILEEHPFFADIYKLITGGGLAIRPSTVAGSHYGQVTALYFEAATKILGKEVDALAALTELEQALAKLGGWSRPPAHPLSDPDGGGAPLA